MKKFLILLVILVIIFTTYFGFIKKTRKVIIPVDSKSTLNAFQKYDSLIEYLQKTPGAKDDISLSKCSNGNEEGYVIVESPGVASQAYYYDKNGNQVGTGWAGDVGDSGGSGRQINFSGSDCVILKKNY